MPMWEVLIDPGESEIALYLFLYLFGLCLELMALNKLYDWSLRIYCWYQRRYGQMKKRVTYRPSKVNGIFGTIWGIIFVLIGLFVAIPVFGLFGILWTLGAAAAAVLNAVQVFGKHYAGPEIHIEEDQAGQREDFGTSAAQDPKGRLEQLKTLKTAGLISEREYQQKRQEILRGL